MAEVPQVLPWTPAAALNVIKVYNDFAQRELTRVRRNLDGLSDDDRASLVRTPQEQVRVMKEAADANDKFLEAIAQLIQAAPASPQAAETCESCQAPSSKSVQHLLQLFVREWSAEGLAERRDCFEKLLGALDMHFGKEQHRASSTGGDKPRVLCPGSQLSRIPFEVASRGYQCEGCEGRVLSYFGSELMRSGSGHGRFCIQPFSLNTCNRLNAEDHVRKIQIPEVEVPSLPPVRMGEFTQLYDVSPARASFDAVLSAYSIEASPNPLRYVRTVAHVVRPGGLWASFGPLCFDGDHDDACQGLELSWEELRHAISHFFEVKEEGFVDAFYAQNCESLMQHQLSCIHFVAVRNEVVSEGIGDH